MTLSKIAYKNVLGNMYKYIMYYLSNTIAVSIFFIFSNFINNHYIKYGYAAFASKVMFLCQFVIIVFTLIFSSYSISNFFKSREKEFGLLFMFGFTKAEIRKYMLLENIIVSLASIVTGIFFGMLFSKLFFMAAQIIINTRSSIGFAISPKAILITFFTFTLLFQGICLIVSNKIKNNNIANLLKGDRIEKPLPRPSFIKSINSLLLLTSGYILALNSSDDSLEKTFIPIVVLILIGTYLLFSQLSVLFTNKLKSNKLIYYKGINMIIISQIVYKMRDTARILFIATILITVTLTCSITAYSLQKNYQNTIKMFFPQEISFLEEGPNSHKIISPSKVEEILKNHNIAIAYKTEVMLIKAENPNSHSVPDLNSNSSINEEYFQSKKNQRDFYIMKNSDYNMLAKKYVQPIFKLNNKEILIYSYNFYGTNHKKIFSKNKFIDLNINDEKTKWSIKNELKGGVINTDNNCSNIAVVSDEDFNGLLNKIPESNTYMYYGYKINRDDCAADAVSDIKKNLSPNTENYFTNSILNYADILQLFSILSFIGIFVALIFFVATGSILHFKMFNEIQKDKSEFIALKKVGMTNEELKNIVNIQSLLVYFLPFIVALSHTLILLNAIKSYFRVSLCINSVIIISLIYLFVQYILYIFTKRIYIKLVIN